MLFELLKKCLSTRSRAQQATRCQNWRPAVEQLEARQLQATALTSNLVEGVLTIQGTNRADQIVVRQSGDTIYVGGRKYDSSAVIRVDIDAKGGNDFIDLRLSRPTVIFAGSGNDRVQGGGKEDVIYGGQGRDILSGGAGDDLVFGEGGVDVLRGGQGDDYLDGGSASDRVIGGAEDGKAVTDLARADLAAKLQIAVDAVSVESLAGVAWPDPSLGCPLPEGMSVAAVITPGYRITLKAGDNLYEYHTDLRSRFQLCDTDLASPGEEVLALMRTNLAAKLGVTVDVVHVESTSPTFWLESALGDPTLTGCPA